MGPIAECVSKAETPEIKRELCRLSDRIESLSVTVKELEQHVECVMLPTAPRCVSFPEEAAAQTGMGMSLRQHSDRLDEITATVRLIRERSAL